MFTSGAPSVVNGPSPLTCENGHCCSFSVVQVGIQEAFFFLCLFFFRPSMETTNRKVHWGIVISCGPGTELGTRYRNDNHNNRKMI